MIERKFLAHYVDAAFSSSTPTYVRLGKNLEEYNEELNPDVEVTKNILGEQSVQHSGYVYKVACFIVILLIFPH